MHGNNQTIRRKAHMTQTFESSITQEHNHKFHMDRTLYKGIKDNDVSKIIDISKEAGSVDYKQKTEEDEVSQIVIEMRKKFDEVRTETKRIEAQLEKNRKIFENLKTEEEELSQKLSSAKSKLQARNAEVNEMGGVVQARVYDLDIYKQIQRRLKHDILITKKRNFDKDILLNKDNVKLKTLKYDQFNKTRLSYRCRDMLQSIQKTVANKQAERTTKINSFYQVLDKRHQNQRRKEEREREIEEVMINAMSQKLQEEKQWINICMVNIFLKKFLKNKMERLIEDNKVVESAYHKIRSSTDISDSKELITRFLNREKDYGTLLDSIAQKQMLLQNLRQEKSTLQVLCEEQIQRSDQLHDSTSKQVSNYGPLQKELQNLAQQLKDIKYKKQLMRKWATRFHCVFISKAKEQVKLKYENRTSQLVKDVLSEISNYIDHVLGEENCSDNINKAFLSTKPTNPRTFDDDMIVRNKRIKTTAPEQLIEGEEREAIYDGVSQADYLQYNRRATKKNDQSRRFRIKTQSAAQVK